MVNITRNCRTRAIFSFKKALSLSIANDDKAFFIYEVNPMSVSIEIEDVIKKYGDLTVIKGLSLNIKPGEFFTLLGPSGCGKTTLLRMVIGFNSLEAGTIKVNGRIVNDIPANKRNMGMVFQNYAIFPNLNVFDNVAFGLKNRKIPKEDIEEKVNAILKIVRIEQLRDRMPEKLSGGQQQRVALARAIVISPEVLLMDEPLCNLDGKLRVEMRNAIKNIQNKIGITTIYVTHDQEEALAISDRIAVMNAGVIQQVGKPKSLYQRPANIFVANFIGLSNILEATVRWSGNNTDSPKLVFDNEGYTVEMTNLEGTIKDGQRIKVSVRPEEFEVLPKGGKGIKAIIDSSVFLGLSTHYFMTLSDGKEAEIIQYSNEQEIIPNHTEVRLLPKPSMINVFNYETECSVIKGVSQG